MPITSPLLPRVTVVGARSLIAQALKAQPACRDWRFLSHVDAFADTGWRDDTDVLLNCAFDNRLKTEPWQEALDVDVRLAHLILDRPAIRQVMLSSRMAYGPPPPDGRLVETATTAPVGLYGQAKRHTEQVLHTLLGERLMVLRLSNIFGNEALPGRQNFLAMALRSLRDHGRISLDMSPFVERDFLPVQQLAAWMPQVVQHWQGGLFNLGLGRGTPTGRIAQWLIEGHGSGELHVSAMREHDAFWLDMSHSRAAFALDAPDADLVKTHCHALGRALKAPTPAHGRMTLEASA